MATVLVLPGAACPIAERGAVPSVVERIEQLLALAREGRIRALGYAFVDREGAAFSGTVSAQDEPNGLGLIAAVTFLHHEIVADKLADTRTKPGPT